MGQRLPNLDLSGLISGTRTAAELEAQSGANLGRGIEQGAENAVAGYFKKKSLAQQQQKIDISRQNLGISQGHLDLARQTEQDKWDEMTLKRLDAADLEAEAAKAYLDPQSPEYMKIVQEAEDRDVIRKTVDARHAASPVQQMNAASKAQGGPEVCTDPG